MLNLYFWRNVLGQFRDFFFSFLKSHAIGKNYDVSPIAITS